MNGRVAGRTSIYTTLAVVVFAAVALVLSANAAYSYVNTKARIIEQMKADSRRSIAALKNDVANLVAAYAVNDYENLVLNEMDRNDYLAILVEDYNMASVVGEETYLSGKIRDDNSRITDFHPNNKHHRQLIADSYFSEHFDMVGESGNPLGIITIHISDRRMNRELNDIVVRSVINTVALSLLLVVTLFSGIQRTILKPLARIISSIQDRDRDGIPNRPVPEQGPKELVALSQVTNAMITALRASRDVLSRQNESLARSRRELMQERGQLKSLISTIPDLIWLKNTDGVYLSCNSGFEQLLGAREQEIIGRTDHELLDPEQAEAFRRSDLEVLAAAATVVKEQWLSYKSSGYRGLFETIKTPMRNEEGDIIGVLAISRDITQHRNAQLALQESERRLETVLANVIEGIVVVDLSGLITYSNSAAHDILDISRDAVTGKYFQSREWRQIDEQGQPYPVEKLPLSIAMTEQRAIAALEHGIVGEDGTVKWLSVNAAPLLDESRHLIGAVASFRDVTQLKKNQLQLKKYKKALETTHDGFWMLDLDGLLVDVNQAYADLVGYSIQELVGMAISELDAKMTTPKKVKAFIDTVMKSGYDTIETLHRHKDGHLIDMELTASYVPESQQLVAFCRDIRQRKHAARQIEDLAFYDPLTGLPNRRLLQDRLERELAFNSRHRTKGALFFIDLDNFKSINDTLGHHIGDLLLQQTAQRLLANVRDTDTVSRPGGDEFVVLLHDLSDDEAKATAQAQRVAHKILQALDTPYQIDEYQCHNTSSIGITLLGSERTSISEALQRADIAMYQAKKGGRNTLRFFEPQMQASLTAGVELERALRSAIEHGEFQLHYQVQVDHTAQAVGAEALIRWLHPERGMVAPGDFIRAAEDSGQIVAIGDWVLHTACARLRAWQRSRTHRNLTLSINVSAQQFHGKNFVEKVMAAIQAHRIDARLLCLELTESILLEDIPDTIAAMHELKTAGVRFSLDDFGTGYSSLQYLKRLPLDQVKIDRSFVRDIAEDSNDKAIVVTIIAMARTLGLEVIAEGVETETQRDFLLENGCTLYQGYLFGRPVAEDDFAQQIGTPTASHA